MYLIMIIITLYQHQSLRFVKPKNKVVGAEFERLTHATPRSAHAPGLFLKPAHRCAPASAIFDPLRFSLRSRSAHMLCRGQTHPQTETKVIR